VAAAEQKLVIRQCGKQVTTSIILFALGIVFDILSASLLASLAAFWRPEEVRFERRSRRTNLGWCGQRTIIG
jgi:hypothetical protein